MLTLVFWGSIILVAGGCFVHGATMNPRYSNIARTLLCIVPFGGVLMLCLGAANCDESWLRILAAAISGGLLPGMAVLIHVSFRESWHWVYRVIGIVGFLVGAFLKMQLQFRWFE